MTASEPLAWPHVPEVTTIVFCDGRTLLEDARLPLAEMVGMGELSHAGSGLGAYLGDDRSTSLAATRAW